MSNVKIEKSLKEKLNKINEKEKVVAIVTLSQKYPYNLLKHKDIYKKAEVFKNIAEKSQKRVIDLLNKNFKEGKDFQILRKFWVFNGFHILATKKVIYFLSGLTEVDFIEDNKVIRLNFNKGNTNNEKILKDAEWNVTKVKADSCWMEGYTGEGAVVGHIDSGVDTSHPALKGKFLSPYWFDAVNNIGSPYDDYGHGTHTMGTILGGDGLGPFPHDIGVAPDAKFVACKGFNSSGNGYDTWLDACMQKIADWKIQDSLNIVVCSNSWGGPRGYTHFWDIIYTWLSLGIVPVFAAGNSGPNPATVSSPGDYPHVLTVGATDNNDNIASFSSRGPSPSNSPYNDTTYWFYPDWNYLKPDVSAPGVNVLSSIPGGGYVNASGTSMATPHIAGAICILNQKNHFLDPEEIFAYIVFNARQVQQGAPYPNNNYGWGVLDVYKALKSTPFDTVPNIKVVPVFTDYNSNGIWEPGETLFVSLKIKNISAVEVTSLNAKMKALSDYAYTLDSLYTFPDIPPGDSADNLNSPFKFYSQPGNSSDGIYVNFKLNLTYNSDYSKEKNFIFLIGTEGTDFVSHDCGNILVTITRYGTIGYMGSNRQGGFGVEYPKNSGSLLYFGSFALGTQLPYMIDRYLENGSTDNDWVTVYPPDGKVHMYEPGPISDEFSRAIFEDLNGEEVKNIRVIQRGYSYSSSGLDDFIILEYVLKNRSLQTINGLYAGIFLDWDIDDNTFYMNRGNVDNERNLVYMNYYTVKYMGSAVLRPKRNSSLIANLSLINNPNFVYPYNGLPDSIQIRFMNGSLSFPSADSLDDWATVLSVGPFDIASGDSIIVAFAIAGGNSLGELLEAVDSAYSKYWNSIVSVNEDKFLVRKNKFKLLTNFIKKGDLRFISSCPGLLSEIYLFDTSGRYVFRKNLMIRKGINDIKINRNLASGIYILKLLNNKYEYKSKIIVIR